MGNVGVTRVASAPPVVQPHPVGRTAGGNKPIVTPNARASVLAGKDNLSSLLSAVAQRQAIRRVEKPAKGGTSRRRDAMSDPQRVEAGRIRALMQSSGANFGAAYEQTRDLFPAPEELALVLAGLLEDEEIDAKVKAEIDDALAALIREHGRVRISAGLNTGHVVNAFASRMNIDAKDLRRVYRALVGANSGEAVTYRHLIDTFGFERRGLALEFLECALAADIASEAPSHPPEAFQPLLDLLFQLRLIRSADDLLLSSSRERHGHQNHAALGAELDLFDQVLVDFLIASLVDIHAACRQLTHCLQRWRKFARAESVSDWVNRILRAMSAMPVELFPDLAYREALLSTLYSAVDDIFAHRRGNVARLGGIRG